MSVSSELNRIIDSKADIKTQVNIDKDLINQGNNFINNEKIDSYDDKIELMQEAYKKFIPINTTSGTEITLDNSNNDKALLNIGLDGNTEQTTYTGKNLFNNSLIQIGKAWNNDTNTARAIIIIPVTPSTDYTVSFNSISGLEAVYAFGRANQNDSTKTFGNLDITGTRTITTTSTTNYLGLQFNKNSIALTDITNCLFQVEKGSTSTAYEPYVRAE